MSIVLYAIGVYLVGLGLYLILDNGKEAPEGLKTDAEHYSDGKTPIAKSNPLYLIEVVAEFLYSYPAAALRKLAAKLAAKL